MDRVRVELLRPRQIAEWHEEAGRAATISRLSAGRPRWRPPVGRLGRLLIRLGCWIEAQGCRVASPTVSPSPCGC